LKSGVFSAAFFVISPPMRRIGINGFGRIGRYFTRLLLQTNDVDVIVVNDLADSLTLAHLLKYDSIHGRLKYSFEIHKNELHFENGKRLIFLQFSAPNEIPWRSYEIEIVLESTGKFVAKEQARLHLVGGAKKIILSAPSSDEDVKTIVLGVNDHLLHPSDELISNASCTTNNAAPMIKVISGLCEIESAFVTTVHSYTTDQRLHDAPHRDLRRARAAAESIVPTSTGAAKALTRVFPELADKIGGCGVRVPVPNGSFTDITMVVKNPPTVEAVNEAMKEASLVQLKGIISYTEDPIVSVDIIGEPFSCIFDAQLTSVINNMVKIVGWYDNEAGYSNRLVELFRRIQG
jgi:glyceraldehyde 3-phosphate dehydrogenase